MTDIDMHDVRDKAMEKLRELRNIHGAFHNFSYCAIDNKKKEIDITYNNKLIGTLYAEKFVFSNTDELEIPIANIIWDLCTYLQKYYGRGDYSDGQLPDLPKKNFIKWNDDGSINVDTKYDILVEELVY